MNALLELTVVIACAPILLAAIPVVVQTVIDYRVMDSLVEVSTVNWWYSNL